MGMDSTGSIEHPGVAASPRVGSGAGVGVILLPLGLPFEAGKLLPDLSFSFTTQLNHHAKKGSSSSDTKP